MKVLMYASVASMIDLFNMENINLLISLGYEVHVACNFESGSITSDERVSAFRKELEERGITTYHIPIPRSITKINKIIESIKITKKIFANENYKLVHCHSPIGSVICRFVAKNYPVKVIYTAHGFHFFKGASLINWIIFYPIERILSKKTDVLITINKEDYKRAQSFPVRNKTYHINGIGVDLQKFNNTSIKERKGLLNGKIKESDFLLISVGQLSTRKNHEIVIKAISRINDTKIKYIIIGEGELRKKLSTLIEELKLTENVFLVGYRQNVSEYLAASDVFVFPSLQEGLPASLMEAMAMGLPTIVSNIRGNSDLVDHKKGGLVVNKNNIDEFVKSIKKMKSSELRMSMGAYNKAKIQGFSTESINSQMLDIYKSI